MEDALLLEKVTKLPDDLKSEVADFVDFLLSKKKNEGARNRPVFGSAKGLFIMQPGFDEPLEDFNEYMQMDNLLDTHTLLWYIEGDDS